MPTLRIPTPLRSYTYGESEVSLEGTTVELVLQDLLQKYPSLEPHLFNAENSLRPYVNIFLGEDNINDLQGLDTTLRPGDRLLLIPSIAGGKINSE